MLAGLEIGEVLLTASIFEVWREIALGVMPLNVPVREDICERISGRLRQFARLPKGQDALCVERNGQFSLQPWFHLGHGEAQAACHRFGNVQMKRHGVSTRWIDSTLLGPRSR